MFAPPGDKDILMPVSRFRFGAVLLSALLLAACGTSRPSGIAGDASSDLALASPGSPPGKAVPLPSPNDLATDPTRFKGLAARDVTAALGDPNFRRHESPAEVWQYYGQGCVLDLFLYDDSGAQRVSYVELRSRAPGQNVDSRCLRQLLAGNRGQQSS
jgi:hypothetical protein